MSIIGKLLDFFDLSKHNNKNLDVPDLTPTHISYKDYPRNVFDYKYKSSASHYKINTLKNIRAIPLPRAYFEYDCGSMESIEYVLQRKATEFKQKGQLDLAVACLEKAIDIMAYAPMPYPDIYERLENYLKLANRFDDARKAHLKHSKYIQIQRAKDISMMLTNNNTADILEVERLHIGCANCACFHDRVYSKNGHYGFPDMDIFFDYYINRECDCPLGYNLSWYNHFHPTITTKDTVISYSNRPFVDDRNTEEKDVYNVRLLRLQRNIKDRQNYDWLCENLPDKAPKSYGAYRNMKKQNSPNFQKLVALAKEHGYTI